MTPRQWWRSVWWRIGLVALFFAACAILAILTDM